MLKRKVKYNVGDRVLYQNNPATVLSHDRRGVRIRNWYGYIELVSAKALRRDG